MLHTALFVGAIAALAPLCHASGPSNDRSTRFVTVDFSDQYNIRNDRQRLSHGGFFNANTLPTGTRQFRGVPYQFGPAHGRYAWSAVFEGGQNPRVLEIDTDLERTVRVYTLISTLWGSQQRGKLAIEFLGDDGAFHRQELVGNVDVRDYNRTDTFTNTLDSHTTRHVFDNHRGQRIDRQVWTLPDDFADETLSTIRVVDTGADGASRAIVFAITAVVISDEAARREALALLDRAREQRVGTDARELINTIREEREARRADALTQH